MDLNYNHLIKEFEFEDRKFIPIIQLCSNSLLLNYDTVFEKTIKLYIIDNTEEKSAVLELELLSSVVQEKIFIYKIYGYYDFQYYKKGNKSFSNTNHMLYNTVNNVICLYKWGFITDFTQKLLL